MILEDGNNIYSIFNFFAHFKKLILNNLVELNIDKTFDLKYSSPDENENLRSKVLSMFNSTKLFKINFAHLEMNGILYAIKRNTNCINRDVLMNVQSQVVVHS